MRDPEGHRGTMQRRDGRATAAPLLAEMLGVFALTFVDAGGAIVAAAFGDAMVGPAARSAASGLTILAFSYSLGDVSGAHFNPAVTLAFALRRVFPWQRIPSYWLAQLLGAVVAYVLLRLLFGPMARVGANEPHVRWGAALAMEAILTFMLVTIVLCTSLRSKVLGPHAALATGSTVTLAGVIGRPVSGASMNPARSLGPALIGSALDHVWIYIVGPLVGACAAVLVMRVIHHHRHMAEREAAAGNKWISLTTQAVDREGADLE